MALTAAEFFQSTATEIAAGGTNVAIAHGLTGTPTVWWFDVIKNVATKGTDVVRGKAADGTSVFVTNNDGANAVSVYAYAFIAATIADATTEATHATHVAGDGSDHADVAGNTTAITDLRRGTAAEDTDVENFPTAFSRVRTGVVGLNNGAWTGTEAAIANGGTCTLNATALAAAFPDINFSNPTRFKVDNPLCSIALSLGTGNIVTQVVVTNGDSVNTQFCNLRVEEIHSICY